MYSITDYRRRISSRDLILQGMKISMINFPLVSRICSEHYWPKKLSNGQCEMKSIPPSAIKLVSIHPLLALVRN
jgi:hypothetical protein